MKIKPSQLNIGTELYQYSSKILQYEVIGINELKTENHIEKFYIIKCLSCNHSPACELAIKFNDIGELEYSHMVNQFEDYDNEYYEEHEHYRNREYYWHKNKDYYWFLNRKDARLFIHNKNLEYYKENIKKAEEKIAYNNRCINEEQDKINALNNE